MNPRKIAFKQLKEDLANFPKYPGTVTVEPGPMINEGYPSNFNLSFAYYEWTKKEGQKGSSKQYISYVGDMFYTKCQPCIRPQDWETIVSDDENKYRYLSYFHMADVGGLIARMDANSRREVGLFAIQSLISFFKQYDLDLKNVFVAYCAGGKVSDLTDGKYTFDKHVDPDPFFEDWIDAGIPKENMVSDTTRDTLLSLRNYSRPSPWGYRNEIFYKHNGRLLDIATIEHLCFEPVFDEEMNTVDIKEYRHAFSISAVGVERVLMVLNGYKDIREVDLVAPLYEMVRSRMASIDDVDVDSLVQTLRPIQAIITDDGQWSNLNSRRKEIARAFYMEFGRVWSKYGLMLDDPLLVDFLNLNAQLLEHENMKDKVQSVMLELRERIASLTNNKHVPEETRMSYKSMLGGQDFSENIGA